MEVKYENGYGIVDGIKFRKDKHTGYYLSALINGKRKRLHRYMYEKYKGNIPNGYQVHHIDQNKDNNETDNLIAMPNQEHKLLHGRELTNEQREFYRKNMDEKARPKAIEWHKSEEAIEWHKEQYKRTLGARKPTTLICEQCGNEYQIVFNGTNRFCSNKCKSAWRRRSGVDNETRKCVTCGNEYECKKYSRRTKCENCTPERYKKNREGRCLQPRSTINA